MQECDRCGVQVYSDIFDCMFCSKVVCEECIDDKFYACVDCIEKEEGYEVSTSYKVEW